MSVPAIDNPGAVRVLEPERPARKPDFARAGDDALASHLPADPPHLSFVNGTTQAALATLDRVAPSRPTPTTGVAYANDGLSQALRAVAGAMVRGIGTKVFWVQTGGYDTHATQTERGERRVIRT